MKKLIVMVMMLAFCLAGSVQAAQLFTMEMYQKIYPEQAMTDTIAIMGSPGTPTATTTGPGIVCQGIMWQNPNGSNIQVLFMNGKVSTKAQAGLK